LLSDDGALVGVNSFKEKGESLNFAVALGEIRRFLAEKGDRLAASAEPAAPAERTDACEPNEVYSGKREKERWDVVGVDLDCDGKAEMELRLPFDKKKPLQAAFDRNKDGVVDLLVFSFSRSPKKWDLSLVDVDFDGTWDLVGFHDTGEITATRYEPYSEALVEVEIRRARGSRGK
jgi:hypothetical protein